MRGGQIHHVNANQEEIGKEAIVNKHLETGSSLVAGNKSPVSAHAREKFRVQSRSGAGLQFLQRQII